jgi:hypothetical protein
MLPAPSGWEYKHLRLTRDSQLRQIYAGIVREKAVADLPQPDRATVQTVAQVQVTTRNGSPGTKEAAGANR